MSKGKTILSIFLFLSLLLTSSEMIANERRGAQLKIFKTDGEYITGELIAVKSSSLLLMDSTSSADVSVSFETVESVEVVRKPRIILGAGLGLAIGAGIGVLTGFLFGSDEPEESGEPGDYKTRSASEKALTIGTLFGLIGAIGGGITGAYSSGTEVIQFEGRSQEEMDMELEKLRLKARYPDFK
jgi:hypothetical protein